MINSTGQGAQTPYSVNSPGRGRRRGCIVWAAGISLSLLAALAIVISAAYAGWNTGLNEARARSTGIEAAELQGQCQLLRRNLADGKLDLAQSRITWLEQRRPAPACLLELAPMATEAYLQAQPSPTLAPTITPPPPTWTPAATFAPLPLATATSAEQQWFYDLVALLAQARTELDIGDYPAAIQTLEAIVSIDENYEREQARSMLLEALTAQALALYRSFKLSEAIILTERAEAYGDIGELNYERYVADTFLIAQRYKTTNPAEAARLFGEIVYQRNRNYMNGQVVAELQDALHYYGDALLESEPCRAREQYAAALGLSPSRSLVSRGELTARQQEAAQACGSSNTNAAGAPGIGPASTPLPIGVRGG